MKCQRYESKTLFHILHGFKPHVRAGQICHNVICDWLVKPISASVRRIAVNHAVPGYDSQLCLGIVVTNKDNKKILMINVTNPFEAWWQAFAKAKYKPLADILSEKGHKRTVQAQITGVLGVWDLSNESIL